MTAPQVLIPTALAALTLMFGAVSATSTATAETSVRSERTNTTCYVLGHSPVVGIDLVVSLGDCS